MLVNTSRACYSRCDWPRGECYSLADGGAHGRCCCGPAMPPRVEQESRVSSRGPARRGSHPCSGCTSSTPGSPIFTAIKSAKFHKSRVMIGPLNPAGLAGTGPGRGRGGTAHAAHGFPAPCTRAHRYPCRLRARRLRCLHRRDRRPSRTRLPHACAANRGFRNSHRRELGAFTGSPFDFARGVPSPSCAAMRILHRRHPRFTRSLSATDT